ENHRLVGLTNKSKKWTEVTPAEFSSSRLWAYTAGAGDPVDHPFYGDEIIQLAAWAVTDSNRAADGRWAFYQSGPGAERIRLLLKQLDIEFRDYARNRDTTEIDGKKLKNPPQISYEFHIGKDEDLDVLVPDRNRVPEWVFSLSERQARLFIDEVVFCDGSEKRNSNARMIYVCRDELRDDLQCLCVMIGVRA